MSSCRQETKIKNVQNSININVLSCFYGMILKFVIALLTKLNPENRKNQIKMLFLNQIVPENYLLRNIDSVLDWSFIYDIVEDKYCLDSCG